jgi:hypothetical protein
VTPDLPVLDGGRDRPAYAAADGAAWPAIVEKAFAGLDGVRPVTWRATSRGITGYARLGLWSSPGHVVDALARLTGIPARAWPFESDAAGAPDTSGRRLADGLRRLLGGRNPVIVHSRAPEAASLPEDLVAGRSYEVVEIDERDLLHLHDPRNAGHPRPLTVTELKDHFLPYYVTFAAPAAPGAGATVSGA